MKIIFRLRDFYRKNEFRINLEREEERLTFSDIVILDIWETCGLLSTFGKFIDSPNPLFFRMK